MPVQANVEKLLKEAGELAGVSNFELDEYNFAMLTTGDGIGVNIEYVESNDTFMVYTTLGEITDENRVLVYEALLQANFRWNATDGTTLGIDPERRAALLTASMDMRDLDAQSFLTSIERIAAITAIWAGRIQEISNDDEASMVFELTPDEENFRPGTFA